MRLPTSPTLHKACPNFSNVITSGCIGPPRAALQPAASGLSVIADFKRSMPGLALCVGLTAVAKLLEQAEVTAFGQPYLEGLVIAILLGVALRTVWKPGPLWASGI